MMLPSNGRFEYSPITQRPKFDWPGGARLAVYVVVAIEHFPYGEGGLGVSYSPGIPQPNTYNWGWREYGNRVGGWRLLDLLGEHGVPPTVILNTACYEHCPELIDAYRAAGAEFVAHGYTNSEQQNGLDIESEGTLIADVTEAIQRHEGHAPLGWMSPGANPSANTEDLLAKHGYRYTLDWPIDDQPVWLRTDGGPLLSMPYPHEVNDVPMIIFHNGSARDFADMAIDTIDELLEQADGTPLVCGIVAHSFIVGQPHRLRQFRRVLDHLSKSGAQLWLTTPGQIADAFAEHTLDPGQPA
jgi:allantoinase